jgi:hypothetical protein
LFLISANDGFSSLHLSRTKGSEAIPQFDVNVAMPSKIKNILFLGKRLIFLIRPHHPVNSNNKQIKKT